MRQKVVRGDANSLTLLGDTLIVWDEGSLGIEPFDKRESPR